MHAGVVALGLVAAADGPDLLARLVDLLQMLRAVRVLGAEPFLVGNPYEAVNWYFFNFACSMDFFLFHLSPIILNANLIMLIK